MNVLIVGGGGREHALVKAVQESGGTVFSVMKNRNPGIARASKQFLLADETNVERVVAWVEAVHAAPIGHRWVRSLR